MYILKCILHLYVVFSFQVTLTERIGENNNDYNGQAWDQFAITPASTNYFRIQAVSVYSTSNNGFGEIEVFGFQCKICFTCFMKLSVMLVIDHADSY